MKSRIHKAISLLLALAMLLSILGTSVFAAPASYLDRLEATDASVTLDGTNPGEVTVNLAGTGALTVYSIEGNWDTSEQEGTNKLTLSKIESDILTFSGLNYVDAPSGKVLWQDMTFSIPGIVAEGSKLLKATYTVAADTPSGTYTVRFRSDVLTPDDYNPDTTVTYYTATITVTNNAGGGEEPDSYLERLKATDASVALDGTNPGEVTVNLVGTGALTVYSIEGNWDTSEQEGTNKLTLSKIESDILTFSGLNYVDAPSGKVLWQDMTFSIPGIVAEGSKLLKATYTVAADTPSGTYTVRFRSDVLTPDDYNPDTTVTYYTATITVTRAPVHVCDPILKDGQDATCTEDGWMDYYQCSDQSCGKLYADKGCTDEITDLDAWKIGDGKIPASHDYGELIEEDPGTHTKDEVKDGMKAHYFCDTCDSYFDRNYTPVEEEDLIIKNEHSFTTENGYREEDGHADTCSCGAHDTVEPHEPNIPAATEDQDQICSVCEYVLANALGHVHANHLTPVAEEPADCTENGHLAYYECSCGKAFFEDATGSIQIPDLDAWLDGDGKIPATGHTYDEEIQDEDHLKDEATNCTEYNTYWYDCSVCDANAKDDEDATDKFWTSDVAGDHNFVEMIEDEDHYVEGTGETCQEPKEYYYDCEYCDEIGEDTWRSNSVGDHVYNTEEWGYKDKETGHAHMCYYCDEHDTVQPHIPGAPATEDEDQICTECEIVLVPASGHVHENHLTPVDEKPADCTEDGHKAYYECSCGEAYFEEDGSTEIDDLDAWKRGEGLIPATGHTYDEEIEDEDHLKDEATNCSEYNTYWYDCSVCDANAKDDPDAADAFWTSDVAGDHSFTEEIEDEDHYVEGTGTCQEGKEYYYDCEYCDEIGEDTWVSDTMGDHSFTEEIEDEDHYVEGTGETCQDYKEYYYDCEYCDEIGDDTWVSDTVGDHDHGEEWKSNWRKHWNECACGDKANEEAHVDNDGDRKCDVCEYKMSGGAVVDPPVVVPPVEPPVEPPVDTPPQTGDSSMMWLWIVLLVVSSAGVITTIAYDKKRSVR